MKLPSIQSLWLGTTKVVKRFPIQFLLAIIATIIWWLLIDTEYQDSSYLNALWKLLYTCNLALTLTLAADLYSENHQFAVAKKWLLKLLALGICAALHFLLQPWVYNADLFRVFLLAFASHLLVAFAPFIGRDNLNGFWQYNKSLFLRFLTAAFYSGVLYAGLGIALAAIDGLFDVTINYKIYMKLLAFVGAGFTTVFFLAGIPEDFKELDEEAHYPKGLKIFTQYVLIPLMTIYLAILLVYEIKIAIAWQLPKGIVSTLILGYSVFGILSLLLIYPIRNKEGNSWIRLFSKFFYLMMIPLIALLILAITKRVGIYGITEPRYILMLLALWLASITIYFLTSKKQNIKVIPVSLAAITLLACYGPQSAFSISKLSQTSRLAKLMKSKKKADRSECSEVVRYLVKNHGLPSLQQFTKVDLITLEDKMYAKAIKAKDGKWEISSNKVDTAFSILNLEDTEVYDYGSSLNFMSTSKGLFVIKGYDAFYKLDDYSRENHLLVIDGKEICVQRIESNANINQKEVLEITVGKTKPIYIDIEAFAKNLYQTYKDNNTVKDNYNNYNVPANKLQIVVEHPSFTFKLLFKQISANLNGDELNYLTTDAYLLIKQK